MSSPPFYRHPIVLILVSLTAIGLSTAFSTQPLRLSSWRGSELSAAFSPVAGAPSDMADVESGSVFGQASAVEPGGERALEAYNQASALQESAAGGRVRFYRRDLPGGGALAYFVVQLDDQ